MPISSIRLDHVAVAVPSIEAAHARWVDELGGAQLHGGDSGIFEAHQYRYTNGAKLELIAPSAQSRPASFVGRFLAKRGAGIHHITFKVHSLAEALDAMQSHGLDPVDVDLSDEMWKEAFLRPSQVGRIVLQIAESTFSDEDWARFSGAPLPQPPPGAASLVGPLLGVESLQWAESLYAGLLGGQPEKESTGRLVFSWPDSALVISVTESSEPGAQCLLVEGWDGSLPAHPRFGPPVRPRRA
jgi:catechol 2,3-dioxygenase-like lactoylglutathione lyase family enzyme